MKSIIVNQEQKPEYPCLKISVDTGNVVLFTGVDTGTLVSIGNDSSPKDYSIGEYGKGWTEGKFKPFTGTVELSN